MRKLYLIRHGRPDFPQGARVCLGRTDTPLGPLGRMQACLLGEELRGAGLSAVFSSPLSRAVQTARFLTPHPIPLAGLEELSAGAWDGLDFSDIQLRWPEHYAARGKDPGLPPPGGEDAAEGQRRFLGAVRQALRRSAGDIAIVAHNSVNQTLLCHALNTAPRQGRAYKLPYASYCVLEVRGDRFHLTQTARNAHPPLTVPLAAQLLAAAEPPERTQAHCRAVAAEASRLAALLPLPLDVELLTAAALLHDVARGEAEHAKTGGSWLRSLGYEQAADLVSQHHDLRDRELDEAALLYLADKCIRGTRPVSVAERFARSRERCRTEAALSAWRTRLETARQLREQVNRLAGRQVVR